MRVAAAQLSSGTDPSANLALVAEAIGAAAQAGATLVVLPEAAMCRFGVPLAPVAEPLDGPWARGVRAAARDVGVTAVVGMFTPADDGHVTNTLLVTGRGVEAHYDKIHLYDAFGFAESRTVAAGRRPVTVEVDGVTVGVTTCYDIRFPALYTALASRGAAVITVSASWGAGPGKLAQWTLLARARACDTASFVVAAGQADPGSTVPGGAPTGVGGSVVVSPYGVVLAEAGAAPHLLVTDVDVDEVAAARDTLGVLANRVDLTPAPAGAADRGGWAR